METFGISTFPDGSKVFSHTQGTTDLSTGVATSTLQELTGGTGRFENVTGVSEGFGCLNPPNDPEGAPAIVICDVHRQWTF